jgi:hypothetical protein
VQLWNRRTALSSTLGTLDDMNSNRHCCWKGFGPQISSELYSANPFVLGSFTAPLRLMQERHSTTVSISPNAGNFPTLSIAVAEMISD